MLLDVQLCWANGNPSRRNEGEENMFRVFVPLSPLKHLPEVTLARQPTYTLQAAFRPISANSLAVTSSNLLCDSTTLTLLN